MHYVCVYLCISVDPTDGKVLRNVAMELTGVAADKIHNAAYWLVYYSNNHFICYAIYVHVYKIRISLSYIRIFFSCCYSLKPLINICIPRP